MYLDFVPIEQHTVLDFLHAFRLLHSFAQIATVVNVFLQNYKEAQERKKSFPIHNTVDLMAASKSYTHNPYSVRVLDTSLDESRCNTPGPEVIGADLIHQSLCEHVNFVHYPQYYHMPVPSRPADELVRLFVGQVPYDVTEQQVAWMVYETTQCNVYHTEIIKKWTGDHHKKGCVHTYCSPEDVITITERLHHRVLIDDAGIWVAETQEERSALEKYCESMKNDKSKRFVNRPFQPVVVEKAMSNFKPRSTPILPPPMYMEYHQQFYQQYAMIPPPSYEEAM